MRKYQQPTCETPGCTEPASMYRADKAVCSKCLACELPACDWCDATADRALLDGDHVHQACGMHAEDAFPLYVANMEWRASQ